MCTCFSVLLFWSVLHSLRQMQICCLCRSLSNLCTWQCPDSSLWKFLTTIVCPCGSLCVAVLGNHAHKQCQNSQSFCSRLHERKWKHILSDIRGAEQLQLLWFVSARCVVMDLALARSRGSASGLLKKHNLIFNFKWSPYSLLMFVEKCKLRFNALIVVE